MTEITQAQAEQILGDIIDAMMGTSTSRRSNQLFTLRRTGATMHIGRDVEGKWVAFLSGPDEKVQETLSLLEEGERGLL